MIFHKKHAAVFTCFHGDFPWETAVWKAFDGRKRLDLKRFGLFQLRNPGPEAGVGAERLQKDALRGGRRSCDADSLPGLCSRRPQTHEMLNESQSLDSGNVHCLLMSDNVKNVASLVNVLHFTSEINKKVFKNK